MGQDCFRPKKPKDLLCPPQGPKPGPADGMGAQTSALGMLTAHRAHLCSKAAPPEYDSRKCLGLPRETLLLSVTSSRTGCLGGLLIWGRCWGAVSGPGEAFASRHQYVLPPLVQHPRGLGCLFISAQAVSTHTWAPPKGEATWETGQSMRPVSPVSTLCPAGSQ